MTGTEASFLLCLAFLICLSSVSISSPYCFLHFATWLLVLIRWMTHCFYGQYYLFLGKSVNAERPKVSFNSAKAFSSHGNIRILWWNQFSCVKTTQAPFTFCPFSLLIVAKGKHVVRYLPIYFLDWYALGMKERGSEHSHLFWYWPNTLQTHSVHLLRSVSCLPAMQQNDTFTLSPFKAPSNCV